MTIGQISNSPYRSYYTNGYGRTANIAVQQNGSVTAKEGVQNPLENGHTEKTTVKPGYRSSPAECRTCKERKYQDGSNESDVSFKSPGHIAPQASAAAVMAHEQEHVSNAYQKAMEKDGHVVSANVSLKTAICPECGTSYVSGGLTRTTISYPNEDNPYQQDKKTQDAIRFTGANIDIRIGASQTALGTVL